MMDRRQLLASASALGAAAFLPLPASARDSHMEPGAHPGDAALDALMGRWFEENLDTDPEGATSLGLDRGENAERASRLADRSGAAFEARRARATERWAEFQRLPTEGFSETGSVNRAVAAFTTETQARNAAFPYGAQLGPGRSGPYVLSQLSGAYFSVPDFLDTQHRIESAADGEGFIKRLEAFGPAIDADTDRARHDAGLGVIPPTYLMAKTLRQVAALRDTPTAEMAFLVSATRKAADKGVAGDWAGRGGVVVDAQVKPALERQHAFLTKLAARAGTDPAVSRLPDGEAFYAASLRQFTTTDMGAEEIHALGLEQVAEITAGIDEILTAQGIIGGSVGERVAALNADPAQLWPNTEAGKVELIASLNAQVAALQPLLPQVFGRLPRSAVEVRRVPPAIEAGAPGGYYQGPPLDGSRPGAYYINLRDTANWPKFSLPTLTYHEASPGHHLQVALQRESDDLPAWRKAMGFSAFSEGWALYAEQVAADDLDVYADDPLGRVGFLLSYLFRAVRLVVDTGLHAKGWSRDRAIQYMVASGAKPGDAAEGEIDRYCVMAGQATSYKVGHTVIARLRETAQGAPGFDIRAFHDGVLKNGSVPLAVLEEIVGRG